MKTRVLAFAAVVALAGCSSPHERLQELAIEVNPLRQARVGDSCRYRAVRDDGPGADIAETWTLRVSSSSRGLARVDVAVLGPDRARPSPSPREPGYSLKLPTADAGIDAVALLRLFHRPDLTTEGMITVADREELEATGSTRRFTTSVLGKTRDAHELTVRFKDRALARATYRIVVVDELSVLGIVEAELEEEWVVTDPDGQLKTQRRHDLLTLVEARGGAEK